MTNNTRAIDALLEIMHDDSDAMSPRRRVEAPNIFSTTNARLRSLSNVKSF